MLPFYDYLFRSPVLFELYDWLILTGWTAIWLLLAALAFLLTPRGRKSWWQYLAVLLAGALSIWSFIVAYNSYQQWLSFNSQLPHHGLIHWLYLVRLSYIAAIQTCQYQFALEASVLVLLVVSAAWRLQRAFTRNIDLAPGKYYGRLVRSLILTTIGLCGLGVGIFLFISFYMPLTFALQYYPLLYNEPTLLIIIGLFTGCLSGPPILLLLGLASFVERRSLVRRATARERRVAGIEQRVAQEM